MQASIAALTAAFTPGAIRETGLERARQQAFTIRMLVLAFGALAAAPFFLAFSGAPSPAQIIVFTFCLSPIGSSMFLVRTGQSELARVIAIGCMLCVAMTATLSADASPGLAFAWLVVAQIESLASRDARLVIWSGLASLPLFAASLIANVFGPTPANLAAWQTVLPLGLALGYGALQAFQSLHLATRQDAATQADLDNATALADVIEDVVTRCDFDGTVTALSHRCERLLHLAPQDLAGRGLFERIHVADRPIYLKAIGDAAHGHETIVTTFRLRAPAPEVRQEGSLPHGFGWVKMRARADGRSAVTALLRDVTAQQDMADALGEARRAASRAAESKDHFLANMSHELRTPLNAIIGFSEILGNDALRPSEPAKQTEYARIIHQSGQHLLAVVNSILDMAKLQSGTFSITPEMFDSKPLVESCLEIVTLKAHEGRVDMVSTYADGIEPLIGDRRACKQILINLLSNAIKFTPENGQVAVDVRPDGNALCFSVTDTGIGIGAVDLTNLGRPFFQVKSALDRPYEGTGLGLSVVRGLVGLHGGSISIESEFGRGTKVSVRLPLDCRYVSANNPSATIETIARRRSAERTPFLPSDTMVKKRA